MKFFHPVFALIVFGFFFKVRALGTKILSINDKSPEAEQKPDLIVQHGKMGVGISIAILAVFIGGIVSGIKFLNITEPFMRTYGHAFIGIMIIALLISQIIIGKSIKNLKVTKIKNRFFNFHKGIFVLVVLLGLFSLITGAIILISGPSVATSL